MTKKTKSKQATREERTELLERLWAPHARKLVEKLEKTPAVELDAATFNSAAKLLSDNGITADALNKDHKDHGRVLADEVRKLREAENDAALRDPVPTPPSTEETRSALQRLEEN